MTDIKRSPRYLYDDFVHPDWHLNGRFGMLVSTLLSKITVRMLNSLGCVSVGRTSGWTLEGFRNSLSLLEEGKNLHIFPEDPRLPLDPDTLMCPFMSGFVGLCRMYQDAYGAQLPVYPMAVFPGTETIAIGKPEFYNKQGFRRDDIHNFTRIVEEDVHRLYLGLKHGSGLI
jgi:1-acyl-sn-glycerol-3-phosphate acyltransferase